MKLFISLIMTSIILTGCGPATIQEVKETIEKTGKDIKQEKWIDASEEAKTIDDWWQYVKNRYPKSQTKDFEKSMGNLPLHTVVQNKEKSLAEWKKLVQQWNKINSKKYQITEIE